MEIFRDDRNLKSALVKKENLERLARRYASEGKDEDFGSCALLLELAGHQGERWDAVESVPTMVSALLKGMEEGLAGRTLEKVPAPLVPWITAHAPGQNVSLIRD